MKNKNYIWVGFLVSVAAVAVVFAGVAVIKIWSGSAGGLGRPAAPKPDAISVTPAEGGASTGLGVGGAGDKIVENKTAGYYFAMPAGWYLEKNAGAGVTVYPDYDPVAMPSSSPACKIEISAFAIAAGDDFNLDDWITGDLHADPTAGVAEDSRTTIEVDGQLGVEWQGTMNGVTTTLDYVASPTGAEVFEIAPSTLSEASDADNGDCVAYLQELASNLKFGTYSNQ